MSAIYLLRLRRLVKGSISLVKFLPIYPVLFTQFAEVPLEAFVKSFWLLGVWHSGRVAYWRFFWSTLLKRPRQFRYGMELAIIGFHFRRVAQAL